jgi:hypothetical protein
MQDERVKEWKFDDGMLKHRFFIPVIDHKLAAPKR